MTGLTTYACNALATWVTGQAAMPAVTNAQVALFLFVGSDDGTGFTEVSGVSYNRVQTTPLFWGPPSGLKPVQITNTRSIVFPVAASNWGSITGFGLYDTNNGLLWADYLGNFPWVPFTATTGANGIFNSPAHGFAFGDQIVVTAEYGGALPQATASLAGILTISNIINADSFQVGATITVSGNGMLRKVQPLTINLNQTASFNPAALVLQLA